MNRHHARIYSCFCCLVTLTCGLHAAVVTWDITASNVNYHNPGQISNAGGVDLFVDSFTFNNSSLAVNGVTFNHYTGLSGNHAQFNNSGITVYMGTGTKNPGISNAHALSINNYALTVSRAGLIHPTTDAYIRYAGLEVGTRYLIQIWMAAWDSAWPTEFSSSADFTSGVSAQVTSTGTAVDGKWWPQYINGTFTADATEQVVYYRSPTDSFTLLAAGQIRVLAVPEPGTMALILLGGFVFWLRNQRLKYIA